MAKDDPRVGETVLYFENNVSAPGWVAQVTLVHSPFLVNLMVCDGSRWLPKTAIHWRQCSAVKANPAIGNNCGVWDYTSIPRQFPEEMPAGAKPAVSPAKDVENHDNTEQAQANVEKTDDDGERPRSKGGKFASKAMAD